MNIRPHISDFEKAVAGTFARNLEALPGNEALRQRRREAFARFSETGLPTRHNEDYHYTDLKNLLTTAAPTITAPQGGIMDNGLAQAAASMAPAAAGVEIYGFTEALTQRPDLVARIGEAVADAQSPVVALNTALFAQLAVIVVKAGIHTDVLLHHLIAAMPETNALACARALVIVEEGAVLTLVDSVPANTQALQANMVIELLIADKAQVRHIRSETASPVRQSLVTIAARLGAGAEYDLFCLNGSADLSRTEVRVAFDGAGGRAGLRGVNLLRHEQLADITLMVDHRAPACESRELFRHVVDQQAIGTFQGKIMVKQAAQKTDGQMASNAILLSDDAVMNNKPELEIFADDVLCAHGATCGALDDDLLFYLQARGLARAEAEALMIQAFCGEAIEFVGNEALREALNQSVSAWLATRTEGRTT